MENKTKLTEETTTLSSGTELTSLESQVIARSEDLNEAALCSMFELTHEQVSEILAKK